MIGAVGVGAASFFVMEPLTYAAHRWVMHGIGWVWHRSHHRRRAEPSRWAQRFEANDWFPVVFAAVTIVVMAVGTAAHRLGLLVPLGVGVTVYGAAYAFVHDLYIHGRFVRLPVWQPLEHLREAHALHHRFGAEPYGMLCPIIPRELRAREQGRPAVTSTPRPVAAGSLRSRRSRRSDEPVLLR